MLEQEHTYNNQALRYNLQDELYDLLDLEVELHEPITSHYDNRLRRMHTNETKYCNFLLQKGVIVFPEPNIVCIKHTPDFFVWTPNTQMWETPYSGVFIELTLCSQSELDSDSSYDKRRYARKRRQRDAFNRIGLPLMYVYKEDQERIPEMGI
jgi:hypothetical protein